MRRNILPLFSLVCILAVMAFFAWLTRNPDAELVRQAEDWPVVGSWATRFRERYVAPQAPRDYEEGESFRTPGGRTPDRRTPDGRTPDRPADRPDIVWVLPGTVLRQAPSATAAVVHEFDAVATVIKIERRGDWFHVRRGGDRGWIFLEGYDEDGGPPYGEAPEPTKALMPRPPDAATLGPARELLGGRERVHRLGPYVTYTDVDDPGLLEHLDGLADQVESLYRERYGLELLGAPVAALVVYQSELPYRLLEKRSPHLADLHSAGHASRGVAVLYVGDRDRADVGTTLTHELVHFLNRRALGPALPPWLDEGLADDLATARVGADGRIDPRRLGGDRYEVDGRVRIDGALATLYHLRIASAEGDLPSLSRLTSLDWDQFVRSGRRQMYYGASAFWIRYLLDHEDARIGAGLRRFLAGVAVGEPATPEALRDHLGRDWAELFAGFRLWIESHPALPADAKVSGSSSRQTVSPPA